MKENEKYKDKSDKLIADRIYSVRMKLGLTQAEMAQLLIIKIQYLSSLENGRRKPGMKLLTKLIRLCKSKGVIINHQFLRPDQDY